jgi:hypothetical protein
VCPHAAQRSAHSFPGPSAPFAELSGHEMHYHGDSQLEVTPPMRIAGSTRFHPVCCPRASDVTRGATSQGYSSIDAFKAMLETMGGCSAAEAEEQASIALALRRV